MQLINIGFGNLISGERLIAVVSPDSAPIKRMVQEARERGILIRDCGNYRGLGKGWYRTAVRLHEENRLLAEALRKISERRGQ